VIPASLSALLFLLPFRAAAERLGFEARELLRGRDDAALTAYRPGWPLLSKNWFREYEVRIYKDPGAPRGELEVRKKGKLVCVREGGWFTVEPSSARGDERAVAFGRDIDGNGVPDLLVSEFSGGAHCCVWVYLYELGEKFRKLGEIDLRDGGFRPGSVTGTDGRERVILTAGDYTFAYWRYPFSDTCHPEIKLEFRDGTFRIARDLMPRPAPAAAEMRAKADEVLNSENWTGIPNREPEPPSILYGYMLDLIYGGNASLAWEFFDMAWKPGFPEKDEYLADFRKRLATSLWWEDVRALNPGL
jgi:hypothetical protein